MLKIIVALQMFACGQQDAETAPQRPRWLDLAQAHIRECEVFPTDDPSRPCRFEIEPVFHHVQSVRGRAVGSVFVCLEESGRPAAIGDVFFLPSGKEHDLYSEWHSLASGPLTLKWNGVTRMAAETAGLSWQPIPDAMRPAEGLPQRERQLRQLARRFTAHLINREQDKYELRRLSTPLFQYQSEQSADFLNGAVFTFCQETDPELLLVIEARRAAGEPQWMYAAGAFSNLSLFLQLDGTEVWSADPPTFAGNGPHVGGRMQHVVLPVEETELEGAAP
jgi:hypothetical protein